METFKISVRFRDRYINGYVQKFIDHYDVFFQDEEVVKEIGGMFSYDASKKIKSVRKTNAPDAEKFYKAIAEQLIVS